MNSAKTTSLRLEALASAHWPVHAPNTIQNLAMALEDLARFWKCSSSRTVTNFPETMNIETQPKSTNL
jgi:hypothetical protein